MGDGREKDMLYFVSCRNLGLIVPLPPWLLVSCEHVSGTVHVVHLGTDGLTSKAGR